MTKSELAAWITTWLQDNADIPNPSENGQRTFVQLGVDSIRAMMLVGDLEELLSKRLSPTLAWDHPTIDALSGHLAGLDGPEDSAGREGATEDARLLKKIDELSEEEIDALLKERQGESEDS